MDAKDKIIAEQAARIEAQAKLLEAQTQVIETQAKRIAELECEVQSQDERLLQQDKQLGQQTARIEALERRFGLDSSTSSKPPSSDGLKKKPARVSSLRPKGKKPSGGQKGHPGSTLKQTEHPDEIVNHFPEHCTTCGQDLGDVEAEAQPVERQVFDVIIPKIKVTAHRAYSKVCPHCQTRNQAAFPEGVTSPAQYGDTLKAFAIYLNVAHFIPEDRLQTLLKDLFNVHVATGSLTNWAHAFAESLSGFMQKAEEHLETASPVNLDETGFRIQGETRWLHTKVSDKVTHYRISKGRKDLEPLAKLQGVVVHDHWKPYYSGEVLADNKHALCNAHHLRELKAVAEIDNEPWAADLSQCLQFACFLKNREGGVVPPEYAILVEGSYDHFLREAIDWHEAQPPFGTGTARRPGHNLALRLQKRKEDVLRFMGDASIPFTNNAAEQALRMMKVKQKISGGFRSEKGAQIFVLIRSFVVTVAKNAINILDAIKNPRAATTAVFG